MKDTYAIILCGGSGSRLWPRSRSKHPKHLLQLNGGATLVQETVKRVNLPLSKIFCITEASHAELLRSQLPEIPDNNVIIEPDRRGTASAIALALAAVSEVADPDAVVVSLAADHLIPNHAEFKRTMSAWVDAARTLPRIVTLGIRPTYPSTGFGYINTGKRIDSLAEFDVFEIDQFVEKPNERTAETYLKSGKFYWNAGLFGAQLRVFQEEFAKYMPKLVEGIARVAAAKADGDVTQVTKEYLALEPEAIEYGVIEKSDRLAVIPAAFGWADIGSWADLHDVLERDPDGNVFEGEYVDIDSHNCFIYSPDQLVATIGLDNLVIINTGDAVLICPKDRSQDVKKVVEQLKARGQTKYL